MLAGRNRLYMLFAAMSLAGISWIFYNIWSHHHNSGGDFGVCIIKNITGIPCPSCGSSRAICLLTDGDLMGAIAMNPLGIILAALSIVIPIWLVVDLILRKGTLFFYYRKGEKLLRKKWMMVIFFTLILANWIWNITKGL